MQRYGKLWGINKVPKDGETIAIHLYQLRTIGKRQRGQEDNKGPVLLT
jgi:hypothetical protein